MSRASAPMTISKRRCQRQNRHSGGRGGERGSVMKSSGLESVNGIDGASPQLVGGAALRGDDPGKDRAQGRGREIVQRAGFGDVDFDDGNVAVIVALDGDVGDRVV